MSIQPPKNRVKDYLLPFLIIVALGILVFLSFEVWKTWNEDIQIGTKSVTAHLTEVKGEVEVFLPATQSWKIVTKGAALAEGELVTGESVRTAAESQATLKFSDGSVLTLAPATRLDLEELKSSLTKKTLKVALERGRVFVHLNSQPKPILTISNRFLRITEPTGSFFLTAQTEEEIVKEAQVVVVQGELNATVLDYHDQKELKSFIVPAGKNLIVSERRVNLLRIGSRIDLVGEPEREVLESAFYKTMTTLTGGTATEIEKTEETKITGTPKTEVETPEPPKREISPSTPNPNSTQKQLAAPGVTTAGGLVTVRQEPVRIQGTADLAAAKIEVTRQGGVPYVLQAFQPYSGQWRYNAARIYKNLEVGSNTYSVVAIGAAGERSEATTFEIKFQPQGAETESTKTPEALPKKDPPEEQKPEAPPKISTSGVPVIGGATFTPPVVLEPADRATFTEAPISFRGTVPPETEEIMINEYKLTRFTPGTREWYYNADPQYQNLKKGENEYEIVAVSKDGERASTKIKIFYNPRIFN